LNAQVLKLLTKSSKGVIDRFEGDKAVIEINGEAKDFDRMLLPKGAKVGDVLIIGDILTLDEKGTRARKKKIKSLMDDLWED
jgi:hypothetical protein